MQETASFVRALVRHRPLICSSVPPNKTFICILKLIHNLKQEERDFNTSQSTKNTCLISAQLCAASKVKKKNIYTVFDNVFNACHLCQNVFLKTALKNTLLLKLFFYFAA